MKLIPKEEIVSGVLLCLFGIYVSYGASKLPYVSEGGPGPGFFPLWIGIAIALLAIGFVLANFFSAPDTSGPRSSGSIGRALSGWLGLILAIALLPWVGFGLSLALLTAFLVGVLERRPWWTALAVGLVLVAAFHLVFVVALGLALPVGPLGF
jgi:putative tricarboxylic transport membrane protein